MSSVVITPTNPQYSTDGPWSADAGAWGASSLTYGVDYTQSITLDDTTFPNGTLFSWSFPLYGGPFGVWSYPCIVYGSTPELINSAVPSTQVANFLNLSTSYSAALTVSSGQLDTIFDIWLTSKPYGGVSSVKYELEIVPQTDWQYSPLTYMLTDSTLDNAAVYVDPGKIIVVPSSEMLTGTISISDILKSLIWNGVITGQEYISGIEFGPEPGSGSGSLLVNSLNYQWTGTSTVQLTASNDTFTVTTPGGNDIEGNGGGDTVVYNGLYSEFQIKSSGSETLVTENNNISTLDYLQGVTYIRFSDGTYDTVTSTFTPRVLYDFYYVYSNGSYYYGTVADDGTYGYHTGETINGIYGGYYYIYGTSGSTSEAVGTVNDYYYHSAQTGQAYRPYFSQNDGHSLGSTAAIGNVAGGLNGDYDYILANGHYQAFGYGGYFKPTGA